ncbi:MAG TPA: amidohydrolase, partial [Gemmatimonadaceae bacterium]|nr:amidohydrolase [Gemmatimonadaceae bacterium]
ATSMPIMRIRLTSLIAVLLVTSSLAAQQPARIAPARLDSLKAEVIRAVDAESALTQQIVDMLFSFGELAFQEVETSRYLTDLLRKQGFTVRQNVSGLPTAWVATWGTGKPVIAIGSDIDGIPQASQKPGVAYHDPIVQDAPGHGEGHNSGQAVNITAAIVLKRIMQRDKLQGTIVLWPGVAEELLGSKAWFVRDGMFKDVDAVIFSHVDSDFSTSYGAPTGTGLVSIEYTFEGETAHAAGSPWRGRSALDAVELLNTAWNFRREHLRPQHRVHYVIPNGGDQPNVVPRRASVWYYLRETDHAHISALFAAGDTLARAAAMMAGVKLTQSRVLGAAWPRHFNKPLAEVMHSNIRRVGMPQWTTADVSLAKAVQRQVGGRERGLDTAIAEIGTGVNPDRNPGGGSDDIGDVSWVVPTITLRYPSNIPGLPGHNWSSAIAMATPIAHKGATAGAKAMAMTMLDLIAAPSLSDSAWAYFRDVQTKDQKYEPLIRPTDKPPIELNEAVMARFRPAMRRFYYDPTRYKTYLEQLGIKYPTLRPDSTARE